MAYRPADARAARCHRQAIRRFYERARLTWAFLPRRSSPTVLPAYRSRVCGRVTIRERHGQQGNLSRATAEKECGLTAPAPSATEDLSPPQLLPTLVVRWDQSMHRRPRASSRRASRRFRLSLRASYTHDRHMCPSPRPRRRVQLVQPVAGLFFAHASIAAINACHGAHVGARRAWRHASSLRRPRPFRTKLSTEVVDNLPPFPKKSIRDAAMLVALIWRAGCLAPRRGAYQGANAPDSDRECR